MIACDACDVPLHRIKVERSVIGELDLCVWITEVGDLNLVHVSPSWVDAMRVAQMWVALGVCVSA